MQRSLSPQIYFSVADSQMEAFLDKGAFEKSLLLNVLFQPGIVIPDIFCFISRGLELHILKSPRQSLFELCLERGLVTPSFRKSNCFSFLEILEVLRAHGDPQQAIVGIRNSAKAIAFRLQVAADKNQSFSPFVPSIDLGGTFDEVLTRHLQNPEPPREYGPTQGTETRDLWEKTRRWRIGCIDEAREIAVRAGYSGVRRGAITRAVASSLGVTEGPMSHDVSFLINTLPQHGSELKAFFRWLCELYQYNQAVGFNVAPNFPCLQKIDLPIIGGALQTGAAIPPLNSLPHIKATVPFPPIDVLSQVSPLALLQARDEFGPPYFAALMAWQTLPSDAAAEAVRVALKRYAKEIVRWSGKNVSFGDSAIHAIFGADVTPAQKSLGAFLNLVFSTLAISAPVPALLVTLGPLGYGIYVYAKLRPQSAKVLLTGLRSVETNIAVTSPSKSK